MEISKDLAAIGRYMRRQRNGYMAPFGLKGIHARLLLHILRTPGISQDGLAQRAGFDKSNIARQVALLEEKGYLRRSPDPQDKRVMQLFPTPQTQALEAELLEAMERWEQQLLKNLSQQERQTFGDLLKKVCVAAMEDEG